MEYYSPAMSVNSDMTDEELDKYFATYVPLSNLPTPPPAKESSHTTTTSATTSSSSSSSSSSSQTQTSSSPELQGYAQHLARIVPGTHTTVICGFLERASLPDEVVAFAACVLESLSEGFERTWREMLRPEEFERDLKTFLRTDERRTSHVSADVVVLAGLALAHGFLVDRLRSSRHWSVRESGGMFSVKEIEATKRAMLRDMDYGLFKIRDEEVEKMLGEMQKPNTTTVKKHDRRRTLSINLPGAAVWSHGVQTPEPSP